MDFENETKQSQHYWFVRENDVICAERTTFQYFLILLWPDSYFGDAVENAKQLFFSRPPQMTKCFVMRECENIPR
jgi:hypothetical protein